MKRHLNQNPDSGCKGKKLLIPIGMNIGKMQKMPNGKNALSGDVDVFIFDGKKHRQGGPAEINRRTGYEAWFKHGVLHREKGPALIDPTNKYKEYWINGKFIRRESLTS
jgi:hypothetical protein